MTLQFSDEDAQSRLGALRTFVLTQANQQIDAICIRYTKRRIDTAMKLIGLTSNDPAALDTEFKAAVAAIDAPTIFREAKSALNAAIIAQDYEKVLRCYDNKGLLAEAARQLDYQQKALEQCIGRALRSNENTKLHAALTDVLPIVKPRPGDKTDDDD